MESEAKKLPVIRKDSLIAKFPCVNKLVVSKLEEISVFANLVAPFAGTGEVPDLYWDSKPLPWAAGDNNDQYQLGATEEVTLNGWSSRIYINSLAIQNASKLYIANTAIHETIHAYLKQLTKKNFYYPNQINGSWANDAQYWATVDSLYRQQQGNYIDHSNFLEHYYDDVVDILKAYDNNAHTISEYRMAMLYGLNNAGDAPPGDASQNVKDAYNARKAKLDAVYANILTKYNLNATDINAFHSANIINVPTSKKVLNNCP